MSDLRTRDGALIENWYIACLSRELGAKQAIQRVIYDQPLALFRDARGAPRCLPDRCLHRHAQLSEGRVTPAGLACPYHGWVYDAKGVVVDVPSEGPPGKCPHAQFQLKPLACVEQEGCIWVWMGAGEPATPTPPFRFPHPDWQSYFMITDFENEVTHLAENFMDVPHTVFVHAAWFRNPASKKVPITVDTAAGSVLVTYEQPQDQIGFTGRILNPRGEPMTHTDRFILPNLTRVDYGFGSRNGFVIISQCTPVSNLRSRVYTAIIYRVDWVGWLLKPFFRYYTRQVINQDVDIMRNQGRSFAIDMNCRFHATDADVVHTAIERLREYARLGDPKAHAYASRTEKTIWI